MTTIEALWYVIASVVRSDFVVSFTPTAPAYNNTIINDIPIIRGSTIHKEKPLLEKKSEQLGNTQLINKIIQKDKEYNL